MVKMITYNGIRYRPEDAKRLGIKADHEPVNDKAERGPSHDKADRPTRNTGGGGRRGKRADSASAG